MAHVQISFKAEIDDEFLPEIIRIVDHHLDYLIDLDSISEIKNLYEGEVEEIN